MKLNIVWDPADVRPGYTNVSVNPDVDERVEHVADVCEPHDLSRPCAPGEATEVVVLGVLEYLPIDVVDKALDHWVDLVAVGGTISLGSLDVFEVAAALAGGKMSHHDANLLVHGRQEKPWQLKRATYGVRQLAEALAGRGLVVTRKSLSGLHALVTAERK